MENKFVIKQRGASIIFILGCAACIITCQLCFGVLQWFSFEKNYITTAVSNYNIAFNSMARDVENNFAMGKTLERFQGFESLAERNFPDSTYILATVLTRPDGTVVGWAGKDRQTRLELPSSASALFSMQNFETNGTYVIFKPLGGTSIYSAFNAEAEGRPAKPSGLSAGRAAAPVGYLVLLLDSAFYKDTLNPLFPQGIFIIASCTLGALLLVGLLLLFSTHRDAEGKLLRKRMIALMALPLLLVQGACAVLVLDAVWTISHDAVLQMAQKNTDIAAEKLLRILLTGVELEDLQNLDEVMSHIAKLSTEIQDVGLMDSTGKILYSSNPAGMQNSVVGEVQSAFTIRGKELKVVSVLNWEQLSDMVRSNALDALSTFIISVLLMSEIIILQMSLMGKAGPEQYGNRQRGFMRSIGFWFLVALDMSISFIPLRMQELATAEGETVSDLLLGLPVSVEMGAASLSILLSGVWISRCSAVQPLFAGIAFTGVGYLWSGFSTTTLEFILARGLSGFGYGFMLMALQNVVVSYSKSDNRGHNLVTLFAGIYAGSLCGSAMGAMLADRLGYPSVFIYSSILLTVLLGLCFFWARQRIKPLAQAAEVVSEKVKTHARASLRSIWEFCTDKRVLSVMLFSLLPGALVSVGLINFFLPIFLNRAGVSQSDIGRVFTLYCLVFICAGPFLGKWIEALPRKAPAVSLSGIMGGACLLTFAVPSTFIEPLWAALLGAVFLGLFLSISLTAQNSFLLNCRISQDVGYEKAMSLYNTVERLGQVAGPLVFGSALIFFSPALFAFVSGIVFIVFSVLFLLVVESGEHA